ncbi:ECF transporter S component [Acidipropionibacterium timonense]|uniref:ECF transporter S component n=1 Tax=Acidipropionibacterium timonense TaxID=2161818 RepID=UPI00103114A6|nr:ECF transporter S component [Acidipropionibacterium timonense]
MASRSRYRTIDIVTPVMIAVAFGVIFLGLGALFNALQPIMDVYVPLEGLYMGLWLLAGIVAGLVVRKPGAALLAELLAATIEALLGGQWVYGTLISGVLQGLGVEVALALFAYRRGGVRVAMIGGVLAAAFESVYERIAYYPVFRAGDTVAFVIFCLISGAVLGGLVGHAIVVALANAGALNPFPVGRERSRTVAGPTR